MSQTRLVLQGFEELRAALRRLPAELLEEAVGIVDAAGESAANQIVDAYPEGPTGNLKRGVKVTRRTSTKELAHAVIVKSTAPHAYIFENGTQARHTDLGVNRGAMPPGHVVVPIAIRERRKMNDKLIALVERAGLKVSSTE